MPLPQLTEQFVLPFLFVFAVVFGIFRATGVFAGNRAVQMVISFVFAFFSATYDPFVRSFFSLLPELTTFFIVVFLVILVVEAFGLKKISKEDRVVNIAIYGILLLLLFSLGNLYGYHSFVPFFGTWNNVLLLVGIVFIVAIFYHAYKSS